MADTEEYFPRGGKKPSVTYFKPSGNFLGAAEKGQKKKKKPKKKTEGDDGYLSDEAHTVDQSFKNCAIGISYKTVKAGQLILGRVRQVLETKVSISLPCRMTGSVMACHISEPYNKLLEAYVNDQNETMIELVTMFRPGQYVAVKVLEVEPSHLLLSMMPQHINSAQTYNTLYTGALLQAAVSSVEDHGYVMDLGIANTRAFLAKSDACPDLKLDTGSIVWVCVKSSQESSGSSLVALRGATEALRRAELRKPTTAATTQLLPATALQFTIDKPLDNGIEGHVFADTRAYVQRAHADHKGKKPALGQKVRARVLFATPPRCTPFLTTRDIFASLTPDLSAEQVYAEGDFVEDAQVIKISGRCLHFKLGEDSIGTMSLRRVPVHEDLNDEQVIAKSYPIGSVHRVRVLSYSLSDYTYSVSDERAVLEERYFSLAALRPAQRVSARVHSHADNKLVLKVGRMTGFVPHTHVSDAGVYVDPKKAAASKLTQKKFKVGQQVEARVLALDLEKQSMQLTLKPSLLREDLEPLVSYQQAQIGKAYTGVIKFIRDYVVVSFFNQVTCYVPRNYVTREPIDSLITAFHLGQIVNCTILKVDVEAGKMSGSLVTAPFWPAKKRDTTEKRKQQSEDSTEVPKKKKKLKGTEIEEKIEELETKSSKKSKKKKQVEETKSEESDAIETDIQEDDALTAEDLFTDIDESEEQKKTKKKKKKSHSDEVNEDEEGNKSNKKGKKKTVEEEKSEESDAIEIDFQDEDMLTPDDLMLIDIEDCDTAKKMKKRMVVIVKTIKRKTRRMTNIEKKISNIEDIGLNAKNKKYHTAMLTDKLKVQEQIRKLLEVLVIIEDKLKEIDTEEKVDYKKKKEKKEKKKKNTTKDEEESNQEEEPVEKVTEDKAIVKEDKKRKFKEIKALENLKPVLEVPDAKDFWNTTTEDNVNDVQEQESSSDDEEEEQPKKKRKKLTAAEKVAKAREEEERLRALERRAADSASQPQSSEHFERALLANPSCSQLWIAYMAFHLQATEIDKARAVGRKALNTISFREEDEKLNVWLAMINFENRFGTKESQQKILEEALQMNDTYKIHSKLLDIYVETSKIQELTSLVDLMLRKYKRQVDMYQICGNALFKLGLVDKARQVMQKAISVLEKKEHVTILVQFALLERAHGAGERAEALLEQVLAVYPQRVDVASVYVDMLLKSNDMERVRQLLERMTSQKLPARKMKILFKKWIEVEEKHGDADQVERIRHRALEFIDKAKF